MRIPALLIILTILAGCVAGHAPTPGPHPAEIPSAQDTDVFPETESSSRLGSVATSLAEQYHSLSQHAVRGMTLDVTDFEIMAKDTGASCVLRQVFALLAGEIPNYAIRHGIAEPAVLMAGRYLTASAPRARGGQASIRVVADARTTESLHYLSYLFVATNGRVLFKLNAKVDRNWTETVQLEQGRTSQKTGVDQGLIETDASSLPPSKWQGCAASKAEAEAVFRLLGVLERGSTNTVSAVKIGENWCSSNRE